MLRRFALALLCAVTLLAVDGSSDARPGALRRRFGGTFSPATISGLTLWLEADSGITLNGSTVSAWADKSSNGANASQATAGNQPTYHASGGPNGRAYVQDTPSVTTGKYLTGASTLWTNPVNWTICAVTYATSAGNLPLLWAGNPTGSWPTWSGGGIGWQVGSGGLTPSRYQMEGNNAGSTQYAYTNSNATTGAWHTVCAIQNGNGSSTVRVDGSAISMASNLSGENAPSATYYIGVDFTWSTMPPVAALLTYNSTLTGTQIAQVESYLRTKYATW